MVTAGIFMVARMSPLFELSGTALSFVLFIGATTALFTGVIGIVQNDIKRVVAYSTLSQLGYMTVALGVSAYAGGVYHLMTHAFFKALLFLGAGSVIVAMHHEQDMRYMGGLRKYMPITWITMWIGSLALAGAPGFAGFYSKDAIIEAVGESHRFFAGYAYFCVMAGVFVTALYSFRLLYMTFHGRERFVVEEHHGHGHGDDHGHHQPGHLEHAPHESPWVITLPLVLLAIPSVLIGWLTVGPMLFGNWFGNAIHVDDANDVLKEVGAQFHGPLAMVLHGFTQPPFWIAFAGFVVATYIWLLNPGVAGKAKKALHPLYNVLVHKYWVDEVYQAVFARGGLALGRGLWKGGDVGIIDGIAVDGSSALVARTAATVRWLQSGYLYHYAFAMILGLIALLGGVWWVVGHATP
jgi:NADH-quinone oxidoreductase subunit L